MKKFNTYAACAVPFFSVFELLQTRSFNPVSGIGHPSTDQEFYIAKPNGISAECHTHFLTAGRYKVQTEVKSAGVKARLTVDNEFDYLKPTNVYQPYAAEVPLTLQRRQYARQYLCTRDQTAAVLYCRGNIRNNRKNCLMELKDKIMLSKRSVIETINNELKNRCQMEHSRHRCFRKLLQIISGPIAYSFFPKKPAIINETDSSAQITLF